MTMRHAPGDPTDITAWHRLDARLTSSGQPDADQLATLPPLGITHVVNLALPSHEKSLPDEAERLAALGVGYTNIPVDFAAPPEEDYRTFCAVMDGLKDRTVHVHCILNLRVSAFLYRWRQDRQGVSKSEARTELERLWKPGGAWARFIGSPDDAGRDHLYAGRDYVFDEASPADTGLPATPRLSGPQTDSR